MPKDVQGMDFWVRYCQAATFQSSFKDPAVVQSLSTRGGEISSFILDVFTKARGCPGACALVRDAGVDLLQNHGSIKKLFEGCKPLHRDFVELIGPWLSEHLRYLLEMPDLRVLQCVADRVCRGVTPAPTTPRSVVPSCVDADYGEIAAFMRNGSCDDPFGYTREFSSGAHAMVANAALFAAQLVAAAEVYYEWRSMSVDAFVFFVLVFHFLDRLGKVATLQRNQRFVDDGIGMFGEMRRLTGSDPMYYLMIDSLFQLTNRNLNILLRDDTTGRFVFVSLVCLWRLGGHRGRRYEKSLMQLVLNVLSFQRFLHRMEPVCEDPYQLLEFLYLHSILLEPDFPQLDCAVLQSDIGPVVQDFLDRNIPDGAVSMQVIHFLTRRLRNVGPLIFRNPRCVIELLYPRLTDSSEQDNIALILKFLDRFCLTTLLLANPIDSLPQSARGTILSLLLARHADCLSATLDAGCVIDLLCDWEPTYWNFVASVVLTDENARVNHYRLLINKGIHSFFVNAETVLAPFEDEMNVHCPDVFRAIHYTYLFALPQTLILRVTPIRFDPLSDFNRQLIEGLLDIVRSSPTKAVWAGLMEISNALPVAFLQLRAWEPKDLLDVIFRGADRLATYFGREMEDDLVIAVEALTFCCFVAALPQFLDFVVPEMMDILREATPGRILAIALFLSRLIDTPTIQNVLVALMLSREWTSLVTQLLVRLSPEQESRLVSFAICQLLDLTSRYVLFLNQLDPFKEAVTDELMQTQSPFQTVCQDYMTTLAPDNPPISRLIESFRRHVSADAFEKLRPLAVDHFSLDVSERSRVPEAILRQLELTALRADSLDVPPSVKSDAFLQLDPLPQARILSDLVRPPPSLTPAMHRYLVHEPSWMADWIEGFPRAILMAEHYCRLAPVVRTLSTLSAGKVEGIAFMEYCQSELLSALLDCLFVNVFTKSAIELLLNLSHNYVALSALIDQISVRLRQVDHRGLDIVTDLLLDISQIPEFPSLFAATGLPALLDALRYRESYFGIIRSAVRLLLKLDGPLPQAAIQAISYLLCTGTSVDVQFLEAIANFPQQLVFDELARPLRKSFRQVLKCSLKSLDRKLFALYLRKFPFLVIQDRSRICPILDQLLAQRQLSDLELVGMVCEALCPKSSDLQPTQTKRKRLSGNIEVPRWLFDQAPDFWQVVNRHIRYLDGLIVSRPETIRRELQWLMNYPEILSFTTKQNLFRSLQRDKVSGHRVSVHVARATLLEDSYRELTAYKGREFLGCLRVTFQGEQGIDAGGLTRDWLTAVVGELFNPDYALFSPTTFGRSYVPNRLSVVHPNSLGYFELAGRIIARALVDNCLLDAHLSQGFLKQLLGLKTGLREIQDVSVEIYESLLWILSNDPEDCGLTFAYEYNLFGQTETIELVPEGHSISVTLENREEYVQCVVDQILKHEAPGQTQRLMKGFYELIPLEEIRMFRPDELDLLICGVPEIDVDDLVASCEFSRPYSIAHPVIRMLIDVLRSFSREQKAQFLLYVTGSSQMPAGGLRNLANRAPLKITGGPPPTHLPVSHTCYHQLELPAYPNEATMRKKLLMAMTEGGTFTMA
jgi:E3 ubiquitin-protein ligase HUWE1